MNNVYKLKIFDFEGPIEKLVELIEDKKLEINELSLAQITADFLNYLESLTSKIQSEENKKEYLQILSSFVVIASRLIFIKSKSLLNFNLEKDEEAYLDYDRPNYRVKVGNFLNREDAKELYKKLKRRFPEAMIVPDQVTVIKQADQDELFLLRKKEFEEKQKKGNLCSNHTLPILSQAICSHRMNRRL